MFWQDGRFDFLLAFSGLSGSGPFRVTQFGSPWSCLDRMDYDGLGPSALSRWNPQRNLSHFCHFFNTEGQHIPFSEKYQAASLVTLVMKQAFLGSTGLGLPDIPAKDLWMERDTMWHKFFVPPIAVLPECPWLKALSFHGVNPKLCVIAVVTALDDLRRVRTPKSQKTSKDHGNVLVHAAQVCFNDMYILDHPCKWSPKCVELCPGQWPKNLYLAPFKVPLVRAAVIFAVLLENVSTTHMAFLVGQNMTKYGIWGCPNLETAPYAVF